MGSFSLSDKAAARIAELVTKDGRSNLMLRVSVSGGGCSGFQYNFDFDDKINDDDRLFEHELAKVVIDETSLELLDGGVIDFKQDLMGAYFAIENPNATASCGCGTSFSI